MGDLEFKPFPKIPRLDKEIIITEKIDGTNAVVHIAEDGTITAGSRSRWITPGDDNFGFAKWVSAQVDLHLLGPGYHFGEWYGLGIQRGYGLTEKRFALFREPMHTMPDCCQVVPVLYKGPASWDDMVVGDHGDFCAITAATQFLKERGSQLVPGFMRPEGLVIYHTASGQSYKRIFDSAGPKGEK